MFTLISLKYSPLNTAYNGGMSTTFTLQINTQHEVVNYKILHIYLTSFTIAQHLLLERAVVVDIFNET
jgi:hypothetical protein